MSVLEALAYEALGYQRPRSTPAPLLREPIEDAETVFRSLAVEARNDLHVLDDQLSAVNACGKELTRAWLAHMDCMVMNGFEFLQKAVRVESPVELLQLQTKLVEAQTAAFHECCEQCGRHIMAAMARCAQET